VLLSFSCTSSPFSEDRSEIVYAINKKFHIIQNQGEYLRLQASPEITDFWWADETGGLVNAG